MIFTLIIFVSGAKTLTTPQHRGFWRQNMKEKGPLGGPRRKCLYILKLEHIEI
jgi:hypothetical protein